MVMMMIIIIIIIIIIITRGSQLLLIYHAPRCTLDEHIELYIVTYITWGNGIVVGSTM